MRSQNCVPWTKCIRELLYIRELSYICANRQFGDTDMMLILPQIE